MEILQSFTNDKYVKTFWKVFSERLNAAADNAGNFDTTVLESTLNQLKRT